MAKFSRIVAILCGFFIYNEGHLLDGILEPKDDDFSFKSGIPDMFHAYEDRGNRVEDIQLRFYNGKTFKEHVNIKLSDAVQLLQQKSFNVANPTVFYVHGYKETPEKESVEVVVSAYLEARPNTNVILVDWSNMAFGGYHVNAAPNTGLVGEAVAEQIKKLVNGGLPLSGIHIVGHSLGGQVAGSIGKQVQRHGLKIKRISALDPAFPLFYPGFILGHISASDAEFVDVIHTDAGGYGAPSHTGSLDFWPNGGVAKQPGCRLVSPIPLSPEDLCSHWRSWRYWAESVRNPTAFPAVKESSYVKFQVESLVHKDKGPVVYMGINADSSASGDYYLYTNKASPFGKGEDGIRPHKK